MRDGGYMMNKYQKALNRLCENDYFDEKGNCDCDLVEIDRELLQELVDKVTSKKLRQKEYNSLEFKNFKLHSDNTLMQLKKKELISYIHMLYHNWCVTDERCVNIQKYAEKLNSPKPYTFEELHEDGGFEENRFYPVQKANER